MTKKIEQEFLVTERYHLLEYSYMDPCHLRQVADDIEQNNIKHIYIDTEDGYISTYQVRPENEKEKEKRLKKLAQEKEKQKKYEGLRKSKLIKEAKKFGITAEGLS